MAVALGKLISEVKEQIDFSDISNKVLAVDAFNTIYQFLSIIRQPDGSPLVDSKNRVTSHLSGILYRTSNLLDYGITPVYVFDGIPPLLKKRTLEARANRRSNAMNEWNKAKESGQIEEARMHAMASTRINAEIISSSKELLGLMGIPFFQAPSEGEAQAADMVRRGLVYASASQDYDSFLFGADIVIRNVTISGRRKLPKKNVYVEVKPERITLSKFLGNLQINREQLIMLGMLMGTDFNTGVDKVGPMTALKIVKENKTLPEVVKYVKQKYNMEFDSNPEEVFALFEHPEVNKIAEEEFNKKISDSKPDRNGIIRFMCDEHGFSAERIGKIADKLLELRGVRGQRGINSWL